MSWLTHPVLVLGGWTNLTLPVLSWLLVSGLAIARFAPQFWRSFTAWRRHAAKRTNGGTVATAALELAVGHGGGLVVCVLCFAAAVFAGHMSRIAVLPLLAIPLVQLVRAEVSDRVHKALMVALAKRYGPS